jgi:large subunit ribosomal protein L1
MGKKKTVVVEGEVEVKKAPVKIKEEKVEKKTFRRPKKRSASYVKAKAKVDRTKMYSLPEAVALVKDTSYSKFSGSVELHMVVKKEKLMVNATLPHPTGKSKRVEVASETTIEKLKAGKIDFDVLLAKAEIMPKLVPFAKILGPKGLMPNPIAGTLIKSEDEVKKLSADSVVIRAEKSQPVVHLVVGKVSQKGKELEENIKAVFSAIGEKQIVKASVSASMGPGVKVKVD